MGDAGIKYAIHGSHVHKPAKTDPSDASASLDNARKVIP